MIHKFSLCEVKTQRIMMSAGFQLAGIALAALRIESRAFLYSKWFGLGIEIFVHNSA